MFSMAKSGRVDAPVLLWLNGGPGASSLLGFYDELGPFGIGPKLDIEPRAVSWNNDAHLLALDNPLGVGYSHTASLARMATNQTTVGAGLSRRWPSSTSSFRSCGEPVLRHRRVVRRQVHPGGRVPIHERNKAVPPAERINLAGIAIGDGAFDPATQFTGFGPLLFNIGLADTRAAKVYDEYDKNFSALMAAGDHIGAFRSFDEMLNGDYYGADRTFYGNTTGMGSNYFNFALEPGASSLTKRTFPDWLATPAIAKALHVGGVPYAIFNQTVEDQLLGDWVVGVVPMLQTLLDHYDVLIYSGQYDVILGPPGTERAIDKLVWGGAKAYAAAPTNAFRANASDPTSDLAGYVRTAAASPNATFSYVMLRGCGTWCRRTSRCARTRCCSGSSCRWRRCRTGCR